MDNLAIQEQIAEINRKLNFLIQEAEIQKRHRQEFDELKDDLMRVGNDVYHTAVLELEQVHDYINTGDIFFLLKKLLRNIRTISDVVEQLESAVDFIKDVSPISRELVIDIMYKLDELDKKGYFAFAKDATKMLEQIIASFPPEKMKSLSTNMPKLIDSLLILTEPEVIDFISNTANSVKYAVNNRENNVKISKLIKTALSEESKNNLMLLLNIIKNIK